MLELDEVPTWLSMYRGFGKSQRKPPHLLSPLQPAKCCNVLFLLLGAGRGTLGSTYLREVIDSQMQVSKNKGTVGLSCPLILNGSAELPGTQILQGQTPQYRAHAAEGVPFASPTILTLVAEKCWAVVRGCT